VLIIGSLANKINHITSWLFKRQWAEWEIITIAGVVLFVMLWIIRQQRKRAIRNIYDNQFLESTPVIGSKLGAHKRHRHIIRDYKKAQLAAAQHEHTNQQESTEQTESEKLHDQIRQLQRENIKRKRSEVYLEEKVAYLTGVNEQLQSELTELKQNEQSTEPDKELEPTSKEQLQPGIPDNEQAEQQVAHEPAATVEEAQLPQEIGEQNGEELVEDENVERKPPRKSKAYEDLHRVVDDVKQKLCRKCNEWKPEAQFHKNASSKDGLAGSCKTCKAETAREYRKQRKAAQH